MIADDDRPAACCLVMLKAPDLDTKEQPEHLAGKIGDQLLGQQPAAPHGGHRIGQRQRHEQAARRHDLQENDGRNRGGNHEDCVDDVVGGDDARALGGRCPGLHDGVEGNGIDAAEESREEQIKRHPPA